MLIPRKLADFPLNPPVAEPLAGYDGVLAALGLGAGAGPAVAECEYSAATKKLLLRVQATRAQLEALQPDIAALQAAHTADRIRGVMVTTAGAGEPGGFDCLSRYFAPWNGIPEDPVTGSAHTVLGAYWGRVLGKRRLRARQCSPRGGDLTLTVGEERITLAGPAFVVLRGELFLRR